jgi:hypothetical protein
LVPVLAGTCFIGCVLKTTMVCQSLKAPKRPAPGMIVRVKVIHPDIPVAMTLTRPMTRCRVSIGVAFIDVAIPIIPWKRQRYRLT